MPGSRGLDLAAKSPQNLPMANETPPRPNWVPGACIGVGIAFGVAVMNNGLGFESRVLQIVAGAVAAAVVALAALGIAHVIMKRR